MLLRRICICLIVMIAATAIFTNWPWLYLLDLTPPAPQDISRIEVSIAQLKPEDQWLKNVHFYVIPLDGVKSAHKYAILLLTPPAGGVRSAAGTITTLDLTASTAFWTTVEAPGRTYSFPEGIQPIQIEPGDFGPNGDQVAVKFIDELVPTSKSYYQLNQRLLIGSSPTP